MSFDKLDKKVQEAADQYRPAYSEDAWSKMEALLDEHMPQNKEVKRKLPLAWIFALLLIVCSSMVILAVRSWSNKKNNSEAINTEKTTPVASDAKSDNLNSANTTVTQTTTRPGQKEVVPAANLNQQAFPGRNTFNKKSNNSSPVASLTSRELYEADDVQVPNKQKTTSIEVFPKNELLTANGFEHQIINNINVDDGKIVAKNISVLKSITPNSISNLTRNKKPETKIKGKFNDLFSLNFSVGPDVSAVDVRTIGTIKLLLGAGIGYNLGKRWQIKTGVYAVKKVYDAATSDYHPPANFWTYYPNLDDVSANCNVIEVPLILNYAFSQQVKQSWFVSAGISSYFMKKETYTYHSKLATGQYQDKSYTIKNQNKHYLSSLRLSAGYEKKLNNTISLSAEPYLNLPLSGIGFGKVKLNSAGLLFSLNVKPFVKNK